MKIKLAIVAILSIVLSGCMTSKWIESGGGSHRSGIKSKTLLKDEFIAIGKPKTPIAGYENAIILAGHDYSLLLEPSQSKQQDWLYQVFDQVDLQYMHASIEHTRIAVKNPNTIKKEKIDIYLSYQKKRSQLTESEKQKLTQLGFRCAYGYSHPNNINEEYVHCSSSPDILATLATAPPNIKNTIHQLKKPITLKFDYDYHSKAKSNAMAVLLPVAITVDIVTFPIQMIGAFIEERILD